MTSCFREESQRKSVLRRFSDAQSQGCRRRTKRKTETRQHPRTLLERVPRLLTARPHSRTELQVLRLVDHGRFRETARKKLRARGAGLARVLLRTRRTFSSSGARALCWSRMSGLLQKLRQKWSRRQRTQDKARRWNALCRCFEACVCTDEKDFESRLSASCTSAKCLMSSAGFISARPRPRHQTCTRRRPRTTAVRGPRRARRALRRLRTEFSVARIWHQCNAGTFLCCKWTVSRAAAPSW
mmetsp:Transcript_8074/g.17377  ORF Transcript_8074/g.17377 Transcript_8074/m.17377 type:complete len:242 (-) Transcript_8074:1880-2605(-)